MSILKNKKAQFFAILTVIFTLIILGVILGELFSSKSAYKEMGTAGDRASEINDAFGRLNTQNEYLKRLLDLAFVEAISNLSNEGGLPQNPCGSYRLGNIMYFGDVPTDCASFDNVFEAFDNFITTYLFNRLSKEEKEITRLSLEHIKVSLPEDSEESEEIGEGDRFKEYKYISIKSSEEITEPIKSTQFLRENSIFEEVESLVSTDSPDPPRSIADSKRSIPIDLLCNKTENNCKNYYTNYINYMGIEKLRRLAKFYNLELKSVVITPFDGESEDQTKYACFSVFNSSGPLYKSNCIVSGCSSGDELVQYQNSYLPKINNLLKDYFPKKCILAKTTPPKFVLYKNMDTIQSDDFYCWDVNLDDKEETRKSIDDYNSEVNKLYNDWYPNGYPHDPNTDSYFEAYQFCVPLYDKPTPLTNTLTINDDMFSGSLFGYFGNYLTLPYQYFKRYGELKSVVQELINQEGSNLETITSGITVNLEGFKIVKTDKDNVETDLESEFYDFVDEFIKTIESSDFECVNPHDLFRLYEKSSELKKYDIYMNSTHFYIKISEPENEPPEILSAPKLNGFSNSEDGPAIKLGYCKTDLLGKSFAQNDNEYDAIFLSTSSIDTIESRTLNWYKLDEASNNVCLSGQKFSEESKLYLARKYIEQFQGDTNPSTSLLKSLIKNIIGEQSEGDVENFCDYLNNKKFNVKEVFTECSGAELGDEFEYFFSEFNFPEVESLNTGRIAVLESGKDFFDKLELLEKKRCTLHQNWHSLVFIDTTYSFFKEVEIKEESTKQIELVNPTFLVSFFKASYDPSDFEDLVPEKTSPIVPSGGGSNWEGFETK